MINKVILIPTIWFSIFPPTYYLQQYNTKAEYIRFYWKLSINSIFWCHVPTEINHWRKIKFAWIVCKWKRFLNIHTHNVPTIIFVFPSISSLPTVLANPKSDIFGLKSSSRRTLLALRSLWMILSRESSWRYVSPLASPQIMLKRFFQSSDLPLAWSAFHNKYFINK